MKTAFLFPGQGSQYVGMGRGFFDEFESVRTLFGEASDVLGFDVAQLCFDGPESVLIETDNVQPAVTTVNLACLQVVREAGIQPDVTAGHSLGEYAALHAAGVITFEDTLNVVRGRGQFMRAAAATHSGGMLAVMGLGLERFDAICAEASATGVVEIANHNSPAQVILTGEKDALMVAADVAKKAGAVYSVPLKVSGPWHSRFMREASQQLESLLADFTLNPPVVPVIANVTGDYYGGVESIRRGLVDQVASPVKWVTGVERLIADGVRLFVELGPGSMLAGLIRDIDRSVRVISVESVDALGTLRAALPGYSGSDA